MSVEETERMVREYLDVLLSGGDFASFFAEDVLWTTMETGDQVRGRDAVRDFIVTLHSRWFDASPEIKNVTVADGVAALEAVFVGTHIGEFAGVAATGPLSASLTRSSMTSRTVRSTRFGRTSRSWRCSSS